MYGKIFSVFWREKLYGKIFSGGKVCIGKFSVEGKFVLENFQCIVEVKLIWENFQFTMYIPYDTLQ